MQVERARRFRFAVFKDGFDPGVLFGRGIGSELFRNNISIDILLLQPRLFNYMQVGA